MWLNQYFPIWAQSGMNKKTLRQFAEYENQIQFQDIFINFMQLVLNMFEWKNLPETCNSRFLERTLFFDGKALFFDDPNLGFINTAVNLNKGLNLYGENIYRTAYTANGYNIERNEDNSVLIRNNDYMWPSVFTVEIYAKKVLDAQRSIDVYAKNMKYPLVLRANKDNQTSVQTLVDEKESNEYIIIVNQGVFSQDNLDPINLSIPSDGLTVLWQHKRNLFDEFYTRYGINNVGNDKKERLITDEAQAKAQILELNIDLMYDKRKDACNQINEMYDLNVSVDLKLDQLTLYDGILQDIPRGNTGGNNG